MIQRVLIVEDSPTQAKRLAYLMEAEGYATEIAKDGREGLRCFEEARFDLVLCDIILPGLSGYAVCRKIKSHPEGWRTPVILMSELNDPFEVGHALECGAEGFIGKPFDEFDFVGRVAALTASPEPEAEPEGRLLIVEDSQTQALELACVLSEAGYRVDMADDGQEALERALQERYDLILTDLHLPGVSGFELCQTIRERPELQDVRVVVLTAENNPANVLKGLEAGADDFMTKGREPHEVAARVHRVLRSTRPGRLHDAPVLYAEFLGESFAVRASRDQILGFLVSSFEDVVGMARRLEERTAELARSNQILELEVTERRRAESQAREASEAKSRFLANMSHELRTPLNAIIGYAELIEEDAQGAAATEMASDARKIRNASGHLLEIVNNILDISKIEAGRTDLHLEWAEVQTVVRDVTETIAPLLRQGNNRLTVDCPADIGIVRTDVTKLRQVLLNLFSNACKFTEGGLIRLMLHRTGLEDDATLVLRVSDTGIGIPPERLEGLFEAFAQADNSSTKRYGGAGLGLAISRNFCRLLGGDLEATSEPGRGSTFTARIRACLRTETGEVEAPTPRPVQPALGTTTLLVIDDDLTVHDLIRRFFINEGIEVHSAFNGLDGLRIARLVQPSVVILDVLMGGMDGWTTLSSFKGDPLLVGIPIIMLSMMADRARGYALGAAEYLVKPVDRRQLLNVLRRHCRIGQTATVMVVEDDADTRDLLVRAIKREGWRAVTANHGGEAMEHLKTVRPDLILLDIMMPEMDGLAFLDWLREESEYDDIPVVVVTARALTEDDRARLENRVTRIVQKGSQSHRELLDQVRGLVERAMAGRGN